MIRQDDLENALCELPLYFYGFVDPKSLDFSERIRHICQSDCPAYGKSWACPPGVGPVAHCREKCLQYTNCLMIGTIVETDDISDIDACLATRAPHEQITNQVADLLRKQGVQPYILSTEACAECERCAILDGLPCRMPERMHPCVESHGIVLTTTLEQFGLDFQYGSNMVTWYSLLFYNA